MPQNFITFQGSNNPTTFFDDISVLTNGQPNPAVAQCFVDLKVADENMGDGGVDEGGDLSAIIRLDNGRGGLDEVAIFPGEVEFALGPYRLKITLGDPDLNFMETRVFMDGMEITDDIVTIHAAIDAVEGTADVWFKYVSARTLGLADVTTVRII